MPMTCSSCGKMVPEKGRICPYCRADKTADLAALGENRQKLTANGKKGIVGCGTLFLGLMLGSTIGWGIDRAFWAHANVLGWVGGVLGAIVALALLYRVKPDLFDSTR